MRAPILAICLLVVSACFSPHLDYDDGQLLCDDGGCPEGFVCGADLHCWRSAPTGDGPVSRGPDGGTGCVSDPATCQDRCGTVVDNCSDGVDCGDTCVASHGTGWSCGAANVCVCTRNISADCSGKCGTIADRCGFAVDCSAPENGGDDCSISGKACTSDHVCCAQESFATTCSGDPGDDCNANVVNNCGVQVTCSTACDSGFSCGGNPATPTKCSCNPGAVRCVGSTAQTCNGATSWGGDTACSVACIDGTGCGSCTPSTTQCFDSTHVETCQSNGTFATPVVCPAGTPACRPSTKSCGGVCVPGSQKCGTANSRPAVLQCDAEGQWTIVVQTCTYICTGTTSPSCTGVCNPGETKCSGDTLLTCGSDYQFSGSTACGANHCGTKGTTSSCCTETDAQMCPGTGGATCNAPVSKSCGYQLTCSATCTDQMTCGGYASTPNKCSCVPNTLTCNVAADAVRTCNGAGTGWTSSPCASGCYAGACCVADTDFCVSNFYCDSRQNCGRTVNCAVPTCESRSGPPRHCNAYAPGLCGCSPGNTAPGSGCQNYVCSDTGQWTSGGCTGTDCCCHDGGNQFCIDAVTCEGDVAGTCS